MSKNIRYILISCICLAYAACKLPALTERPENKNTPDSFNGNTGDTTNSGNLSWREYFTDPYLVALIDTALHNNQELNITLQEIEITRNEIKARKSEYLPFVGVKAGAGVEK